MMLISNFINLDGAITPAAPQLTAYLRTPHRPEVRFVGTVRPDIFHRARLVRMLQANATRGVIPQLIREAVAEAKANSYRFFENVEVPALAPKPTALIPPGQSTLTPSGPTGDKIPEAVKIDLTPRPTPAAPTETPKPDQPAGDLPL